MVIPLSPSKATQLCPSPSSRHILLPAPRSRASPPPLQGLSLNYLHLENRQVPCPPLREGLSHIKGWKGTWGYLGSGFERGGRDFPLWL